MADRLSIHDERIDDVPLIIGVANQLGLAEILDRHLGTHGLQQGLHNGQLAVGWLAYILSQADHRTSAVRDLADRRTHTLCYLFGQPPRDVDFTDERFLGVLHRPSEDPAREAIEHDLWHAPVTGYKRPLTGVRRDSTRSYGYHQPSPEGLMQDGFPSNDHRPDLPQLKRMAAAAEPVGQWIASDVHPKEAAPDPLYTPLKEGVRTVG